MDITYVGAGSVAGANSGTSFTVTGPVVQAGDTLLCATMSTLSGGPTPAEIDGGWTLGTTVTSGSNRSARIFYRTAVTSDSEKTWTVTKGSPSTESHAVVFAFREDNGDPIQIDGAGFVTRGTLSASDPVQANAINPVSTDAYLIYLALYYQDQTDFTTPPTNFTTRLDAEGAVGTGSTFAVATLENDGSQVTPANWASNSTTDGFWASIVFALAPIPPMSQGGTGVLTEAAGPHTGTSIDTRSNGGTGVLTGVA